MTSWWKTTTAVSVPLIQVALLVLVQVVGFITAAQWNGLVGKTGSRPTAQESISPNDETGGPKGATHPPSEEVAEERRARSDQQLDIFVRLLVVCLFNSIALLLWLRLTALSGWRLAAMTFFSFVMCMTVMPQSDTLFYLRNPGPLIRLAGRMGLT